MLIFSIVYTLLCLWTSIHWITPALSVELTMCQLRVREALDKDNWPTAEHLDYVILTPEGGQYNIPVFPSLPIHS